MPQSDQGANQERYAVIPRTAIFVRRGNEYLLLKGGAAKRLWAGKYNGLGGHVERGENILASARRELLEETGITADLWLCGNLIVDAGEKGVCLFLLVGENPQGEPKASSEGMAEWIDIDRVPELPAVEDLQILLNRIHRMRMGDPPFAGRSYYDQDQKLTVLLDE